MVVKAAKIMLSQIAMTCTNSHSTQLTSILQGRRFLIVMASYLGKLPFYQKMQTLGIRMVVLDGPGHWAREYVKKGLFEDFIEVDFQKMNPDTILALVEAYPYSFDAVITFEEYATRLAASLAKGMNCTGHPVEAVNLNKFEVRQRCQQAGLPSPHFALIKEAGDLELAAATVSFPAILKPVKGASSCDVFRVDSFDDLVIRYWQIVENRHPSSGETNLNSAVSDEGLLTWQHGFIMVLEEYLDGDEYDIDCLLSYGKLAYASVTEEKPQPNMIETGARLPATCPPERETELVQMAEDTLKALGYTEGVFHVEAKYTAKGARLIEVNSRLGGVPIYQMNKLVWGVDLIEQYLLTALCVPIRPTKLTPQTYLSLQILVAPYSGKLTHTHFLDHLKHNPDVVFYKVYLEAGNWVDGPERNVPGWLGEIIVRGESRKVADQRLEEIVARLTIPLEPANVLC